MGNQGKKTTENDMPDGVWGPEPESPIPPPMLSKIITEIQDTITGQYLWEIDNGRSPSGYINTIFDRDRLLRITGGDANLIPYIGMMAFYNRGFHFASHVPCFWSVVSLHAHSHNGSERYCLTVKWTAYR